MRAAVTPAVHDQPAWLLLLPMLTHRERHIRVGLLRAPLVVALVYAIVDGVAPLLPDNPYIPADIRFYHAIETSLSNLMFGLVVGFLFNRPGALLAQGQTGAEGTAL